MKLISIQEAARQLGVSRATVTEWVHRQVNPLPSIVVGKSGKVRRVVEAEIPAWLAAEAERATK